MTERYSGFIPFSEQHTDPKNHTIHVPIEFDFDPQQLLESKPVPCSSCHSLFKREYSDFQFRWGTIDHLTCIVPNTPLLKCTCEHPLLLDDRTHLKIQEKARLILKAIESQKEEAHEQLKILLGLTEEDINKVRDFTFNRRRPHSRMVEKQPAI